MSNIWAAVDAKHVIGSGLDKQPNRNCQNVALLYSTLQTPVEMSVSDIRATIDAFVAATKRALKAGFQVGRENTGVQGR